MDDEEIKKQEEASGYPKVLELDGVFCRVRRNEKWVSRCFSDLTEEEQDAFLSTLSSVSLMCLCHILSNMLRGGYETLLARCEHYQEIMVGLEDVKAGRLIPGDEVLAELKKKYGVDSNVKKV